jgi:tripartite-type tricarboxylate transporter receptor subunit TctC
VNILSIVIAATVLALSGTAANAQSWPAKPVRVIVSLPAGSATDIVGRAVSHRLTQQLGQPFVVENRPGASGSIAQGLVAKADPDGYTVLVHSSSGTVVPSTIPNLPFDVLKDFSGITMLANIPNALAVAPGKGFGSVKDLVAYARSNPGKINYATVGTGSATHLNAERFRLGAGFQGTQVPYKGTSEALTDLMAGRVDFCFCPVSNVLPLTKDGKLQMLAVGSSKRASGAPDTPTTEEAGVPNSAYNFYVGMSVPSRVPRDIVARLHAETVKALQSQETRERYASMGVDAQIFTPEQFDAYLRDEVTSNAALVKAAGIKSN